VRQSRDAGAAAAAGEGAGARCVECGEEVLADESAGEGSRLELA
jgi:hypothetical protein